MKIMILRKKIYLVILSVIVALIIFSYFYLSKVLLKSYTLLEEKHAVENMGRVVSAIDDEFDSLHILEGDWALWDDTYNFVQHQDPEYIQGNLDYAALSNLKLNFMVFTDTSGKIIFGKGIDMVNMKEIAVPPDLKKHIKNYPAFFSHVEISKTNMGFLQLPQGLLMVASRPISNSSGKVRPAGNLIIGRYFNEAEISHISAVTHLPIKVLDLKDSVQGTTTIIDEVTKKPILVRAENDRLISARSSLMDIYGKDIVFLEIQTSRDFYQQGQTTVVYLFISIIVIGLIVAGITLLLIEKLVLSRLVRLGASVNQISVGGDISSRIFVPGNDELVILGNNINEMLETLEKSQKEMQTSEEKFRNIYDQLPIGLVLVGKSGTIFGANRAFLEVFGMNNEKSLIGRNILNDPNLAEEFENNFLTAQTNRFELEYDFDLIKEKGFYETKKSGKYYLDWVVNPIQVNSISFQGFLGQVQDVTQRKQAEEQLKNLSLYDTLSGLYNRAYFDNEVCRIENQDMEHVSVIMCDVDGLKLANDTLGHGAGDSLLKAAAQALRDCFRKEDIVARIGGDEYAVLLPGADLTTVEKARDRIQAAVEKYNQTCQPLIPLSISLGLATTKNSKIKIQDLLKEADYNMYREKLYHQQSTRNDLVLTLTKAMQARDFLTEWHGERIQSLVVEFAQAVGLPDSIMADLRLFAQFHNIGKVGVPDSILFKPTELTANEYSEMQRHCEIGFRIAQSSQDLMPIANWILHHHEWWDGSGYPCNFKGEQIPLESRIFSLVDAYDAMISTRPYRKAYTHDRAVEEIKSRSGGQFDPKLVDIFIKLLEKK